MALITNLATLKAAVADTLNRDDLTDAISIFIRSAEARFQRDPRVRDPNNNAVLVPLSTTDPNWLLTTHPDIYLYGALVEGAPHLRDDERVVMWESLLQQRIEEMHGSVRRDPARSLALTSYANLQVLVADALNRGDLKNVVPILVTLAEARLSKDPRVRNLITGSFSIMADGVAAPTDYKLLESWYHDGPVYYGAINITSASHLGDLKNIHGATGVPAYAALINGTFRFAPSPDATYATRMTYWQTLTALASGVNWLFTKSPAVYLYACLVEAEPWLTPMEAQRVPLWEVKLQGLLEDLHMDVWDSQWSGSMERTIEPIG